MDRETDTRRQLIPMLLESHTGKNCYSGLAKESAYLCIFTWLTVIRNDRCWKDWLLLHYIRLTAFFPDQPG